MNIAVNEVGLEYVSARVPTTATHSPGTARLTLTTERIITFFEDSSLTRHWLVAE